jgi:CPA1 family monovalent cation:H+ antiporter
MLLFEWILVLLVGAVCLTGLARRINVPYPVLLALGGTALALFAHAPEFRLDPGLTLALFVAPVLLDAAFDFSVRDLKANWIPVTCLVLIAVAITTIAVAYVAHELVPGMPWPAAVALGAIVAPPDAAAATAVLRQMQLPHRLMVILEGESLLNDASALLIYRVAVSAAAADGVVAAQFVPAFALGIVGSVFAGYLLAITFPRLTATIQDAPSATVIQFASTFGVWIAAERLGLSPIVTIVVFAFVVARRAPERTAARLRVPSYAVWDTVVYVLNVLAFVLIGLQLRPILLSLEYSQRLEYLSVAAVVLATVILVRFAWVITYGTAARLKVHYLGCGRWPGNYLPSWQSGLVTAWSGMRGVVTLAAAYALPAGTPAFPYRDLILLCAFCVVVGTLLVHGLTLRPLMRRLALRGDDSVEREVRLAHREINKAALAIIDGNNSPEAQALRREFAAMLEDSERQRGLHPKSPQDDLRARIIEKQRQALFALRTDGVIGDDAFHQLEAQLDLAELSATRAD